MAGKVAILEGRLFDPEDHPRRGLNDERADTLLAEINDLRNALGWLRVDLHHNHTWPAPSTQPERTSDRAALTG